MNAFFSLNLPFSRYISQKCYDEAIEIVHNGACLFLKHKQVNYSGQNFLPRWAEFYKVTLSELRWAMQSFSIWAI